LLYRCKQAASGQRQSGAPRPPQLGRNPV